MRKAFFTIFIFLLAGSLQAQTPAAQTPEKPKVQVNYLNVCTPAAEDQKELSTVLSRVSGKPSFGVDMEISRGRSTLTPSDLVVNTGQPEATQQKDAVSNWVRIRRDFPDNAPLTSAQYSFSVTEKHVSETLVLHFRDVKNILQMSINDSVDSAADPAQVARVQTPADRIRIERFGKSSIVLARCPNADQSAYEPLFRKATDVLNTYRHALNTAGTVPTEITRLMPSPAPKSKAASGKKAQ